MQIDLEARVGPNSRPKNLGSGEPRVAEPDTLASFLSFIMVLLSFIIVLFPCTIALLGPKSLSSSQKIVKSHGRFF